MHAQIDNLWAIKVIKQVCIIPISQAYTTVVKCSKILFVNAKLGTHFDIITGCALISADS